MKTFVLASDRNITAFPSRTAAIASGEPIFSTVEEMAEVFRLAKVTPLEIWNTLPGVTPVKKFTDRATGMARIWKRLANLEVSPDLPQSAEPTSLAQPATVTPQTAHTPRPGSKREQVLHLLKRPNGATLEAIVNATGWQPHTVRGFIAGTLKTKLGLEVESFKTEAGGWRLEGYAASGNPYISLAAAQNIATSKSEPEADREAAIKRAEEIREQFVNEFGTEDDKYGFSHPGSRWGSTQIRRSSVEVWIDVFARHLGQMSGYDVSGKSNNTLGKKLGGMAKGAIWSELSQLIGHIPHAQEALATIAQRAEDKDVEQRDKTAHALLTLTDDLTRQLLNPDDQSKYSQSLAAGEYSIQTAYLFKAGSKVLQAQEFPSPFVLWCSDIEHGEEIRKELLKIFPGNPHLKPDDYYFNGGEYHRWQIITDVFQTFFLEGSVDLMNPDKAASFAKRLDQDRSDDDKILDAYGKDGLGRAKKDVNVYERMKNSAAARLFAEFYFASSLTGMPKNGSSRLR